MTFFCAGECGVIRTNRVTLKESFLIAIIGVAKPAARQEEKPETGDKIVMGRGFFQNRLRVVLFALVAVVLSGVAGGSSFAAEAGKGAETMAADCTKTPVAQSRCIIDAILEDLEKTYSFSGSGGGVSGIKQETSWSYTVSLPQEERVDLITYTVEMSPEGKVIIKDRKTGTQTPNP